MTKTKALIITNDAIYSLGTELKERNHSKVKLFYSRLDNTWNPKYKGKLAASALDDGNGIVFRLGEKSFSLDYSQAWEIQVLFKELAKLEKRPKEKLYRKYKR